MLWIAAIFPIRIKP